MRFSAKKKIRIRPLLEVQHINSIVEKYSSKRLRANNPAKQMRFESKVRKYHTRHRSHPHLERIGQVCGICGNSIEAKTEDDTRYTMSSRREDSDGAKWASAYVRAIKKERKESPRVAQR